MDEDTVTHQNPRRIIGARSYKPFTSLDYITSRVTVTTEVTIPSIVDQFEEVWNTFKSKFQEFWTTLDQGDLGQTVKHAVETWIKGNVDVMKVLTLRRHSSVRVKNHKIKWQLVDQDTLLSLINRSHSGVRPKQGTTGPGIHDAPPPRRRKTQRVSRTLETFAPDEAKMESVAITDEPIDFESTATAKQKVEVTKFVKETIIEEEYEA